MTAGVRVVMIGFTKVLVTLLVLLLLATIGPQVSPMDEDWVVRMVVNVPTTTEVGFAVDVGMAEEIGEEVLP